MRVAVKRAKEAQAKFREFSQEQIDRIVKHVAEAAYKEAALLARLAVEETGIGVVEHKKIKNELGSMGVYESIKDEKTVGVIRKNTKDKVIEIAYPFGVIAAICPTTNPTSTAIFKTLIALKAQNGIVASPHPTAAACTIQALQICHDAAVEAGAPEGLIGWIPRPSIETTIQLMKHRDIDLILATGGGALVRAAYSSGKPAYGVGPGNGPVYLEKTANVKQAVKMIVDSKTFDNGTLCSSEQAMVVHRNIKEMTIRELLHNGGYILNKSEKTMVENVISPIKGRLNPAIVGRSAEAIAEMAGIHVPAGTRLLITEEDRIGRDVPFSIEKLAPILPFYTVNSEAEAKQICIQLLNLGGRGHSCSIHTNDEEATYRFGLEMPVSRIMVNTLASIGAAGATTGLIPSLTLGCGSYGGNISSDNITAHHLFNIKRIAYGIKDVAIPRPKPLRNQELEEQSDERNPYTIDRDEVSRIVENIIGQYLTKQ
ncbi:aldehyde dehydrogenase family protein [Brevibacillus sp. NRS-1366]|uniref:aldehyde dehydrogenase family protein n=1 Tax=Brevibacillus sp. NRS-1366 TaxID=3233899 RepID=UPI003D1C0D10